MTLLKILENERKEIDSSFINLNQGAFRKEPVEKIRPAIVMDHFKSCYSRYALRFAGPLLIIIKIPIM